jgi:SagB-type dehydrogenase family enzyme
LRERRAKGKSGRGEGKYRRSAALVVYWENGELIFENYARRMKISADPLVCSILNYCGEWRTVSHVSSYLKAYKKSSVQRTLEQLRLNGMLERSGEKRDQRAEAMKSWAAWSPAAGFFHFSTKDTEFARDQVGAFEEFRRQVKSQGMPVPLKKYAQAPRTKLPEVRADGEYPEVLKSRRTWRKFGSEAVQLEVLAEVLRLTFGIQGWVNVPGYGRAAMKTSPSGGDLHPIEAYVVAQRVNGLKKGIYHYDAARHELERLREGIGQRTLERNLGNQWWFVRGAFLVVLTAISGRTRWKYDFPRAYRALLLEAGHLGQTFCLTATWLGLAPFCTIAMKDTKWEEWLGIDGVEETVVYVLGAGTRPSPDRMRDAHLGVIGN